MVVLVISEVFGVTRSVFGSVEEREYFVLFFGVWGFAIGWHHKSFFRMLVGLNAGALFGFFFVRSLKSSDGFSEFLTTLSCLFGLLVAFISFERHQPANSILRSFLVGALSKVVLVGFSVVFNKILWAPFGQSYLIWISINTLTLASSGFLAMLVVFYFLIPIPPPLITLRSNHHDEGRGDE